MYFSRKTSKVFVCLISLVLAAGLFSMTCGGVNADEKKTVHVSSADEMTAALADKDVDHIIIDASFEVPCNTATPQNGSYFTVDRTMTIEGLSSDVTLTRTIGEGASNGSLQSIFGIKGNGSYDGIQVSMFKLTLDGGSVFGTTEGMSRLYLTAANLKASGRSLVDVYYKATLNLEDGLTIQNSVCTYSLASLNTSSDKDGSYNYGGGVRVDWDDETGGGTVNVKAGACIKDCAASQKREDTSSNRGSSYGGAIGAYSFARLNVYGGLIENCYADMGGAVGCTNRAVYGHSTAGTFNMYGGAIRECGADRGGAISVFGTKTCVSNLLGGTITDCTANTGGAVSVETAGGDISTLNITPYSENGPLQITGCGNNTYASDYEGQFDGYSGLSLGTSNHNVVVDDTYHSVTFMLFKDDTEYYTKLTITKGSSLGEAFPADPTSGFQFVEWNTSPDGSGTKVDKDTGILENMTVYARWLMPAVFTGPENLALTYGDEDKSLQIKDASAAYGGNISYQWYTCTSSGTSAEIIDGATDSEYQIPKLSAGDHYYRCVVKNSVAVGDVSIESNIAKVTVEPKTVDLSWSDTVFDYDGDAKLPTATLAGVLDGDDVNVDVSGAKTAAGTYTATAKLAGADSGNYVIASGEDSCEFTIKPAFEMPDLMGMNYKDAQAKVEKLLQDNGMTATVTIGWWHNSDPKKNLTVAATTPNPGETVTTDTDTIIIMVYEGYNPPATPTATATPTPGAKPSKTPAKPTTAEPTKASSVTLTLDKNTASVVCGKTVSLKATLKGSDAKVSWKSSDTKVATVDANGKVTTKMAGTVTITATAAGKSATATVTALYKDVTNTKDFWYAPTNYLTGKGVVKGYANQTEFRPANNCTRAQMVTFIWRLQGEPKPKAASCKFSDVKKSDYFYKACIWGNENHIVEGYKDGTFGPQIVCARKHAVTFLWRLANKPSPKSKDNKFKDVKKSDYFYQATLWASEKGILAGYSDGTFRPDGDCLRRQMVTFLYKYDKFVNGKG
ncbi:MAG: S-layer homology domain-containing protein [Clostridiales bacterium]|nr:S-layer homology domain-containing protein [Clostridiales bacterium]